MPVFSPSGCSFAEAGQYRSSLIANQARLHPNPFSSKLRTSPQRVRSQRKQAQPQQWEERKRGGCNHQVQSPMLRSGGNGGTGEPRALQEEQRSDGERPAGVEYHGACSLTRQQARDRHRADQREHKTIGLKATKEADQDTGSAPLEIFAWIVM